jgi:hypothetical protein
MNNPPTFLSIIAFLVFLGSCSKKPVNSEEMRAYQRSQQFLTRWYLADIRGLPDTVV